MFAVEAESVKDTGGYCLKHLNMTLRIKTYELLKCVNC